MLNTFGKERDKKRSRNHRLYLTEITNKEMISKRLSMLKGTITINSKKRKGSTEISKTW
jgi:hypothetical protein